MSTSSPSSATCTSTTPFPPPTARMRRPKGSRVIARTCGTGDAKELDALEAALGNPKRPVAAIVGGAKVSTKLELLGNLVNKVDVLIIGGGMANTFLFAEGNGDREVAMREGSRRHGALDRRSGREGQMPNSAAGRRKCRQGIQGACASACRRRRSCSRGRDDPRHRPEVDRRGREVLKEIKTLVWNGPFGAFETPPFDKATMAIAKRRGRLTKEGKLTPSPAAATPSPRSMRPSRRDFTYVSTAGGASWNGWKARRCRASRRSG